MIPNRGWGRSKVRTEEECRLLLAELGDLESTSALQEELRELAERLVAEYEPDSERE
jgi:hypothetical protein